MHRSQILKNSLIRRTLGVIVTMSFLVLTTTSHAVHRSSNGHGQALVFPYFSVLNGNDSLVTISTLSVSPKALKIHVRDDTGTAALSFNLYLESRGSWTGALSTIDGITTLITDDTSCLLTSSEEDALEALGGVKSGFIEVIVMGSLFGSRELREAVDSQDCDYLVSQWAEGVWANDPAEGLAAPRAGISGNVSIINVDKGTQYGLPAVALDRFSNIVQHTSSEEAKPDLASVHDEGTADGQTAGTLCSQDGCETLLWSEPVDAVAHALLARSLSADFSTESSINAQAEIVFTYPLWQFYENRAVYQPVELFVDIWDREGNSPGGSEEACAPVLGANTPPRPAFRDEVTRATRVVVMGKTVDDFGESSDSPILGVSAESFFPSPAVPELPDTGRVNFYTSICLANWPLPVGGEAHPGGWPVLATILTEVSNGQLINDSGDAIRANYGSATELATDVR